jgi:hypothetical protein
MEASFRPKCQPPKIAFVVGFVKLITLLYRAVAQKVPTQINI